MLLRFSFAFFLSFSYKSSGIFLIVIVAIISPVLLISFWNHFGLYQLLLSKNNDYYKREICDVTLFKISQLYLINILKIFLRPNGPIRTNPRQSVATPWGKTLFHGLVTQYPRLIINITNSSKKRFSGAEQKNKSCKYG